MINTFLKRIYKIREKVQSIFSESEYIKVSTEILKLKYENYKSSVNGLNSNLGMGKYKIMYLESSAIEKFPH